MSRRLTQTMIQKLHNKPHTQSTIIRDSDLKGFAARVSPKGAVSFICEGRIKGLGGSAKRITIGKYPSFSVDQARDTAKEHLRLMYQGVNPLKVQKDKIDVTQESDKYTLQAVFDEYLARKDLKPKTIHDYKATMKFVYSAYLDKPITELTRKVVEDTFFQLKHRSTANKASRILSAIMNYTKGIELANGSRLITENPVNILKDKGVKRTLPRKQSVISPKDLVQILGRLRNDLYSDERSKYNPAMLRAIYLIALTGARKNEICKLKRADVKANYISIKDTKNGTDHILPITDEIRWVIEDATDSAITKKSPWLFPRETDSSLAIDGTSKAVKHYLKTYTLHDCRRTFITTASELGMAISSIKKLVNHKSQDVTDGYIIQRVEQRLPLLKGLYEQIQKEMLSSEHLPTAEEVFKK